MRELDVFDILGPVMIGPSSSHTAGAVRLGNVAAMIYNRRPKKVDFYLHGSFAKTYKGHGTDLALVAGILGYAPDDERIRDAFDHAKAQNIAIYFHEADLGYVHPNTVKIIFEDDNEHFQVIGSSLGGGTIKIIDINGAEVALHADYPTLVLQYPDKLGIINRVSSIMATAGVNIASMKVTRRQKKATMILELDGQIDQTTYNFLASSIELDYLTSVGAVEENHGV